MLIGFISEQKNMNFLNLGGFFLRFRGILDVKESGEVIKGANILSDLNTFFDLCSGSPSDMVQAGLSCWFGLLPAVRIWCLVFEQLFKLNVLNPKI